jgi:hypothetical protein
VAQVEDEVAPQADLALDGEDAPDAMQLFGQPPGAHQVNTRHTIGMEERADLPQEWASECSGG